MKKHFILITNFTKDELNKVISKMKMEKAVGMDDTTVEMITYTGENILNVF